MVSLLFLSPSLHSLLLLSSILMLAPIAYSEENELYKECKKPFDCGVLRNLSYPFWGTGRNKYCGKEGFELICEYDWHPVMVSDSPDEFRLVKVDSDYKMMTINLTNPGQYICPRYPANKTLNSSFLRQAGTGINLPSLALLYNFTNKYNMQYPIPIDGCEGWGASYLATGNWSSGNYQGPGIVGGGTGILASILIYFVFKRSSSIRSMFSPGKRGTNNKDIEKFTELLGGTLAIKRYNFSYVKKITNRFKDKLGQGGYGSVFKGKLADGPLVAVKILNASKGNGEEFINEVASISRTSHVNIVTLVGFCLEGSKRVLIYDFMPNGSLEKFTNREYYIAQSRFSLPQKKSTHNSCRQASPIIVNYNRFLLSCIARY